MIIRLLLLILPIGCQYQPPVAVNTATKPTASSAAPQATKPPALDLVRLPTTRVAVGQNIWLETVQQPEKALARSLGDALSGLGGLMTAGSSFTPSLPHQPVVSWQNRTKSIERRVILEAEVVLTKGFLEHLISRSEAGKDHETIVSSPFDAEILHAALLGAGLQPGKPAKFINEKREADFKPATGETVKIFFEYVNPDGKTVVVPAQAWVNHSHNDKPLEADWVFAGSFKGTAELASGEKFAYFGANDGRVICLTNWGTALLDLPFESVNGDPNSDNLGFKANTAAIPERGTKVRALFEAVPKTK